MSYLTPWLRRWNTFVLLVFLTLWEKELTVLFQENETKVGRKLKIISLFHIAYEHSWHCFYVLDLNSFGVCSILHCDNFKLFQKESDSNVTLRVWSPMKWRPAWEHEAIRQIRIRRILRDSPAFCPFYNVKLVGIRQISSFLANP